MFVAVALAVIAALIAVGAYLAWGTTSEVDRIAAIPSALLRDHRTLSLTLRSALTFPDGTVKYTDSQAVLDLERDRSFVELPDVIRNGSLTLVSQGRSLYVSVPDDLAGSFGEARWLGLAVPSRAEARGARVGPVPDPTTVMLALAGATGTVVPLGPRTLDGTTYEVVRVTVRPARMATRLGRDNVASADLLGGLSLAWKAEVWRAEGRFERVVLRTELVTNGTPTGQLSLDLRVGQLDRPIDIGIPPTAAVRPVKSVREALVLLEAA